MKKLLLIFYLISTCSIYGQLENSNWYFGQGAGLNFNSSTAVLTDGQTNTIGHTAVISDSNGDLLFYTDGDSVWNQDHNIMLGGNDTLNGGGRTVVIVPFPNNESKYYIFSSKINNSNYEINGYNYAVVNMSNGIGVVELTNQSVSGILPYDGEFNSGGPIKYFALRDHMAVAKHSDGLSYWLLINPFDNFFALKIDENGISPPVISSAIGSYPEPNDGTINRGSAGMSISPNHDKVAFYNHYIGSGSNLNEINIYDFNSTNGQFSNPIALYSLDYGANYSLSGSSVEFSPNGNYLYANTQDSGNIYQINLADLNQQPYIISSLDNYTGFTNDHNMRLAMDGRIYITTTNHNKLSVINNPNLPGVACNFIDSLIDLSWDTGKLFPPLVNKQEQGCTSDLYIDETVNSGESDFQQASNTITAVNKIEPNGTANYNAGLSVKLEPTFHAKKGSNFKAYIEGCSNDDILLKNNVSNDFFSLENIKFKEELLNIVLFPNPTIGKIIIESDLEISSYELNNMYGRTLQANNFKPSKKIELNLNDLKPDIYFLSLTLSNGQAVVKRVIKV